MDKKYFIGIFVILLVISVSGCIGDDSNEDENSTKVQSLSENGVTLIFPSTWVKANAEDNASVLAVADPSLKDDRGKSLINVNVEKKNSSNSLKGDFDSNYKLLASNSDYNILSKGNVTVGSYQGLEALYTSSDNGTIKMHKAVWIQKDKELYVILCSAPQDKFDSELNIFDFIISNFKFE